MTVVPVSREFWTAAALERASGPLKLPDAVHVATARRSACDVFLTNDRNFARLSGPVALFLDDPSLI